MGNLTEQDNAWCVAGRYYPNERDAWYARQDEERRVRDRIARAEFWIGVRLAGQTYVTEADLYSAAVELAVANGRLVDDETAHVITSAVAALWASGRYCAAATQAA